MRPKPIADIGRSGRATLAGLDIHAFIDVAPLALAAVDLDGLSLTGNDAWRALIPDTAANRDVLNTARTARLVLRARCALGAVGGLEPLMFHNKDGDAVWVAIDMAPWRDDNGQIVAFLANAHDATQSEKAREGLERSERRLAQALAIDHLCVQEVDLRTGETFASSAEPDFQRLMTAEGIKIDAVHPEDRDRVAAHFQRRRGDGDSPRRLEYRLTSEPTRWLSSMSQTVMGEDGAPERILTLTQDITDRVQRRSDVEAMAFTDPLTGLANRARFQLEFDAAASAADAAGIKVGLIMIDVDHFKSINDTLGHDAGDALLQALADHMRRVFRRSDVVARLGGDEFAILLRDIKSETDLMRPLEALRSALAHPIQHRGQGVKISASIGAALHDDPDGDPNHLMKNADIALYRAKAFGRDQVVLFQPEMRSEVERRLELFRDIRAAIQAGEFILFYQPMVNLSRGSVAGFEALMRWNHPEQGLLGPDHFMAAFDDHDLSVLLGAVAIETALRQMRIWIDSGVAFGKVAINLSAAQFRTGRLAKELSARLAHHGIPADRLSVEVTENVSLGWGAEIVGETVRALHAEGIRIALDDFGTGYASLANLRQFPVDRLKIDKTFVQNRDDEAIVRAVIGLGASLGMEVVAEGVEEPCQLALLSSYGCDHAQGYHFARPMPSDAVPAFLLAFAASAT